MTHHIIGGEDARLTAKPLLVQRRPHWYRITRTECPICGRGETMRERVYGLKPADYLKTHEYVVAYDYCNAL